MGVAVAGDRVTDHELEGNVMEEMSGYEDVAPINLPYTLKLERGGRERRSAP